MLDTKINGKTIREILEEQIENVNDLIFKDNKLYNGDDYIYLVTENGKKYLYANIDGEDYLLEGTDFDVEEKLEEKLDI